MNKPKTEKDPKEQVRVHTRRMRQAEGEIAFHMDLFGDYLAEREGYKEHDGLEALQFYLVQKYHWLPSQVKSLNLDDLRFLFGEEMSGWTVQKAGWIPPKKSGD
jgi:hypothetical protein